jgi:hypothetical protein
MIHTLTHIIRMERLNTALRVRARREARREYPPAYAAVKVGQLSRHEWGGWR